MPHTVDLDEIIDDDLGGRWFHFLRASDFGWMNRIPDQHNLEVEEDDIIVHKEIQEGSRYPTLRYHLVFEDEAFLVDGADVRDTLAEKLSQFLKEHNKLPFGCEFKKVFKNGNIKINYSPTQYENFTLKLKPEHYPLEHINPEDSDEGPTYNELVEYFKNLDEVEENPLETVKTEHDIEKISEEPMLEQVANESGKNTVYVFNTTIKDIDKRKSVYQGHEKVYYLLRVEGGQAAPNKDKDTLRRDLDKANVKSSTNAFEKYELDVGDEVSFNSKYKKDRNLGVLLQNIRKFYKEEEMT